MTRPPFQGLLFRERLLLDDLRPLSLMRAIIAAMKLVSAFAWSCIVVVCAGCTHSGKRSVQQSLIGTWKLVSTEELFRDGHRGPYPDLGPNAKGYLIYTGDGHMCAELMNPARPVWKNREEHATDAEKISAASGFTAYCGDYSVDQGNHIIVHSPDVAFLPNYIGTMQKRPYRLEGSRLIFSGAEPTGDIERWSIAWEKVGSSAAATYGRAAAR